MSAARASAKRKKNNNAFRNEVHSPIKSGEKTPFPEAPPAQKTAAAPAKKSFKKKATRSFSTIKLPPKKSSKKKKDLTTKSPTKTDKKHDAEARAKRWAAADVKLKADSKAKREADMQASHDPTVRKNSHLPFHKTQVRKKFDSKLRSTLRASISVKVLG